MRTILAGVLALCWCGHIVAQNEQSADAKARADQLKAIQAEMTKVTAEARKKIAKLTDANEKRIAQQALTRTMNELRPKLAEKSIALAQENPRDEVGLDALLYAHSMTAGAGNKVQEEAKRLIVENHLGNPKIEEVLVALARRSRGYDEALLKKIFDQNPYKSVKASASFILAQSLREQSEGAKLKDADKYRSLIEQLGLRK